MTAYSSPTVCEFMSTLLPLCTVPTIVLTQFGVTASQRTSPLFWKYAFVPIFSACESTTKVTVCGCHQFVELKISCFGLPREKPPFTDVVTLIVPPKDEPWRSAVI